MYETEVLHSNDERLFIQQLIFLFFFTSSIITFYLLILAPVGITASDINKQT